MSKATSHNPENPQKFNPVKLEIVFDNQRDLDTFGSIFSVMAICDIHSDESWGDFCASLRGSVDNGSLKNPGDCGAEWDKVIAACKKVI
jgi:hypothetical protein